MERQQFADLFQSALEEAARNAEAKLARSIPPDFEIELHGAGHSRALLDPQDVLDVLYLGPDRFYRVVDVAVIAVGRHRTRVFVRVSGHEPGSWDQTWNDPPGSGPFHQLIAERIEVTRD
jgi:hypothetical protein